MTALVIRGDAARLPLPDASVDLIVTSPPYFALRSYTDNGEHYAGQIGSEATPAEFLEALWTCTAEWVRVLKPSGSIWVNLGDKYSQRPGQNVPRGQGGDLAGTKAEQAFVSRPSQGNTWEFAQPKSLMGLPWRYAIGCIDRLGLILRAEVIWDKPNCLSGGTIVYAKVKGRPTTIKVHDLCRAYAPEDVQLWNGQRWTQVVWWQPTGRHEDAGESYKAIRAARKRGDEPVIGGDIEVELRSGERIGCTREHRWPTQRGLIHASDLLVGDVLDTCRTPEGESAPGGLDDEMVGWFVGLYIAEGSRSGTTIQLAGHVNELGRFKRLQELAGAFHANCAVHTTGGNTATINLTGRFIDAMLDTYVGGKTSKDKHLRPACWQRSNRFLRAVLDGYLSGDGHWRADARKWIVGFTDNDYLAADLRSLGARLGLSVRLSRCTHSGFGREWPGWRGDIIEPERRRKPDSEVVAVRQSRARQFWDIGVEDEPHLFALASGVLTHNSLPESVTDRVRRSHEQFFHFTKQPRYFAAVDEIREPVSVSTVGRWGSDLSRRDNGYRPVANQSGKGESTMGCNPLGKLPGSVWQVASEPLTVPDHLGVDHFAAFPTEWPRRIIQGWSPSGICTVCGEGRRPTVDKQLVVRNRNATPIRHASGDVSERPSINYANQESQGRTEATITGYACACPTPDAPTRPAVVVDPFGGTGTVALCASVSGRIGISVDLSYDYGRIAAWRTTDGRERARALRVPPPPPQHTGQGDLFELAGS